VRGKPANVGRGDATSWPTDLKLLADPLEFIREDHMHMRTVCETIERLSRLAAPEAAEIGRVLDFLGRELGLLIQDEDGELRDLLLLRCTEEDEIAPTLERLSAEHEVLSDLCPRLALALDRMRQGRRAASEDEAVLLRDFADRLRRHLIVENAIVLPIARARLTAADIAALRNAMIRRRAVDMRM